MPHLNLHADRRTFLRHSAALAATGASPFALNLSLMAGAVAQSVPSGEYRALVCVYLGGGNDNANTVVPTSSTEHAAYASARGVLTLSPTELAATSLSPVGFDGPSLALHPALAKLRARFNAGQVALVPNVGPISVPTTGSQWNNGKPTVEVPLQLFSHSDQLRAWSSASPNRYTKSGWLGRAGDALQALNGQSQVSLLMSMAGQNALQVGERAQQYQVTVKGPVAINGLDGSYAVKTSLKRHWVTNESTWANGSPKAMNLMERELVHITNRAITSELAIRDAIAPTAALSAFGGGRLGEQLRMVARMIAARSAIGHTRQVFYVSLGGFDFHADLLKNQAEKLAEVDAALDSFQAWLDGQGLGPQVTTFTMSEFGRSLQSNGSGSDHGWGGHHFVMGGAVKGQRVYGAWPTVRIKGPEDAGNGRLIPTTPTDAYAATLASWLGASDSALNLIVPNLSRFPVRNLGFMA